MLVSVVMPARNAERYMREAIESILSQTHRDFELICADDGSTDRTLEIIREYAAYDDRVRVLTHGHWGIADTLNHAIDHASSNWIARMDADDVMEANRLERQIAFVSSIENIAVAGTLVRHINHKGEIIGHSLPMLRSDEEVERLRQSGGNIGFHHPTVLMRRDVVRAVGGYRQEFCPAEDMDLWSRIIYGGYRVRIQDEYLVRYRVHGQSESVRTRAYRWNVRWIERCIYLRQRGLPEPSREEFARYLQAQPLIRRLNIARLDEAWVMYRNATIQYSSGRRLRALLSIAPAALLNPAYVFPRVCRKLSSMVRSSGSPKSASPNAQR